MPGPLLEPRGLLSRCDRVTHALHSSERMDWRTPPWFLDLVRRSSPNGRIALDPATHWSNPTGADLIFSPVGPGLMPAVWAGPCGLRGSWARGPDDLRFTNPPYGDHLSGEVDPDRILYRTDKVTRVRIPTGVGTGWAARIALDAGPGITLVPNRTETEWWGRLFHASHLILFPDRRIPFVDAQTGKVGESPNHGSTVFYRGTRPDLFAQAFAPIGILNPGGLCP